MAELNLNVDVDVKGEHKLQNLGRSLASGGVAVAKFAAVGVAAFTGVAAATSGFASDLNESLSKLGVVFPKSGKAIEKWSETAAADLGISQQAAVETAASFGNLFQAMGTAEKPAGKMSTELVELAADLASFNNIGTDEALEKLRAGLVGEAEPLRSLGIQLSAARVEAKALEMGFEEVDGQLSDSAKAQARYAIIMEDSVKAQGDFARTSDGMANQQRILAATFEDTMAAIGQAFIPIIQEILPHVTAALTGFKDWFVANLPTIRDVAGNVFGAIGATFTFLFTEIIPKLAAAFQWVVTNVFPLVAGAGKGISDAFGFLSREVFPPLLVAFQSVFNWVKANWPTISSVVGQAFGAIANVIKVVAPIIAEVATDLFPKVALAAEILFKALDIAFKGIGGAFEAMGNVFETVSGVIKSVFTGIVGFVKGIWNAFVGFWNSIDISVPSVDIPGLGRIGGFAIGLPDLPMLAAGGIVTAPTLAILGEKGDEAVIPLDRGMPGVTNVFNFPGPLQVMDEQDVVERVERSQRLSGALAWDNG